MQIEHVGELRDPRFLMARRKLEEVATWTLFAFGQEGFGSYVTKIAIEPKHLSGQIVDVDVKITVSVDTFGLKTEDVIPLRLQLNVNPENSITVPLHRLVDATRGQLASIAADARRLSAALSMFEQKVAAA